MAKHKPIHCPVCDSSDFVVLDDDKKSLSAGKALVGTVIAPGVGTVIGAAMGKKGKKLELACRDCGYRWTQKK